MYRYKCKSGFKLDFTTIHRVVLFLLMFTSPKSPRLHPPAMIFFWGIRHVAQKAPFFFLFFLLPQILFTQAERFLWAGVCFSPLSTVVGCLWGVGWIMEGISVGFQRNKEDCFFLKPLKSFSCCVNQSQGPQT